MVASREVFLRSYQQLSTLGRVFAGVDQRFAQQVPALMPIRPSSDGVIVSSASVINQITRCTTRRLEEPKGHLRATQIVGLQLAAAGLPGSRMMFVLRER